MVFSSLTFLCVFLPVVFLLYYSLPGLRIRNGLLIIASLLFYAYGEPVYVLLMLFSIFLNYGFGLLLDTDQEKRKKLVVAASVVVNIGILFVFKYLDMVLETVNDVAGTRLPMSGLVLPVGISFFTFQAMSYVIDVYRGEATIEKNVFHVMLYISFFPQLIAGPIVKYHDIQEQMKKRYADTREIAEGLRRFILGLSKKVLISNPMASAADTLFALHRPEISGASAWIGAVAYLFQIYFDFSGYSDMAIGLGHMFGFHFRENFEYPYISQSIREFWRRWHISLSTWFKEYLYIPLGGNRKGKARTCINKLIVFFTTGLWHGANWTFVLWGMWHGCFMLLEEILPIKRIPRLFRHVYALLVVGIGFVMFRAESLGQGMFMIKNMFAGWQMDPSQSAAALSVLTPVFLVTLVLAVIFCMPVLPKFRQWTRKRRRRRQRFEILGYVGSLVLLLFCMLSLSGGTYNPFIYFRF